MLESQGDTQTPRPRGRRGNTCFNCRRRRIRCDGAQPICTSCTRGGSQFDDCEYPCTSRPSQVEILEDKIATVRDRIRVLEDPGQADHVALHHPYDGAKPTEEQVNSNDDGPSSNPISQAHQFGFFINPSRQRSMLDALSEDQPGSTVITLTKAITLWNIHLSHPDPAVESTILQSALDHLTDEIPTRTLEKTLQIIQAEILIGYYLLYDGKVLQASLHADAAFSIALASGLHLVRVPVPTVLGQSLASFAMQQTTERINAFWESVVLSCRCAMFLGLQAPIHRVQLADISTPWPSDPGRPQVTTYVTLAERPLQAFLQGSSLSEFSLTALYTKAIILLERVTTSQKHFYGSDPLLAWNEVLSLEGILDSLTVDLLLTQVPSPDDEMPAWLEQKRLMIRLLLQATVIRLHLPYVEDMDMSRSKCLEAANDIGQTMVVSGAELGGPKWVDPCLAMIWSSACEVLVCEFIAGRLIDEHRETALSALEAISDLWHNLSSSNGLLLIQLSKCEEGLGIKIKDMLSFFSTGIRLTSRDSA